MSIRLRRFIKQMRDFDFGLSEYDSSLFLLYFFAFPNTWYAHSGFK